MRPLEKTDLVTIRLTDKEKRFLEERARALGTTMSDLLRKGAFADYYVYTLGLDEQSMNFIAKLSKVREKDLEDTANFVLHSCQKGFEKKFALGPAS